MAKETDVDIAPPFVTIKLPSFTNESNELIGPISMNVQFGVKQHVVWIEMTQQNVKYVIHRIKVDIANGKKGRTKTAISNRGAHGDDEDDGVDDDDDDDAGSREEDDVDDEDDHGSKASDQGTPPRA